jgi:hypothetical protein
MRAKRCSIEHDILVACRRDKRISLDRLCMVLASKYNRQDVKDQVAQLLKNGGLTINVTVSYSPTRAVIDRETKLFA